MLNRQQLSVVFWLFASAVTILTLVECYLIYKIAQGNTNWVSAVATLINTSFIAAVGKVFIDISKKNFLNSSRVPIEDIAELVHEQTSFQDNSNLPEIERVRLKMEAALRLAKQRFSNWCRGSHFEFCVFVDEVEPIMFAYVDSTLHTKNRSISERNKNPKYYIEKGYEAVKLLNSPQSQPHYVSNTHAQISDYRFARDEQRKQIGSTLLLCTDTDDPAIVVFSSNDADAFDLDDTEFMSFVRLIVELIRQDYVNYDLKRLLRREKPDLFQD